MGARPTLEIYKSLKKYHASLAYSGAFTDHLTENFIGFSDDLIINQKEDHRTAKTTNFLLCESFQNIVRHTQGNIESKVELDLLNGYFSFNNIDEDYRINSINPIIEKDKEKAVSSLDIVNNKNALELRELYKKKLSEGEFSEKGGAGLGFIQMARKTGKKILYRITSRDEETDWLHQQVMISKKKDETHTSRIDMSQKQFHGMVDSNQILQYKGGFTKPGLTSISGIVRANLNSSENSPEKNQQITSFFDCLYQNAFQHGAKFDNMVEGALVVSKTGNIFNIEMGNLVLTENCENIDKTFKNIIENSANDKVKSNIGIIHSQAESLSHQIDKLDETYSFLVIKLSLTV